MDIHTDTRVFFKASRAGPKLLTLNAAKGGVWSRGCVAFDGSGGFGGFGGSGGFLPAAMTADIGPGKTGLATRPS